MNWSRALAALLGLALAGAFVGNSVSDFSQAEHPISMVSELSSNAEFEPSHSVDSCDSEEPLLVDTLITGVRMVRCSPTFTSAAAIGSIQPEAGLRPPTCRA